MWVRLRKTKKDFLKLKIKKGDSYDRKACGQKKKPSFVFYLSSFYCLVTNQQEQSLGNGKENNVVCHIVPNLGCGSSYGRV
jgi:hypothetical protein